MSEEHPELFTMSARMVDLLESLPGRLGDTDGQSVWAHHLEFAERAVRLADHLRSVNELANAHLASAFVVLRTALEHACVDELLLLADRYRERIKVEPDALNALHSEFISGTADWAHGVVAFERSRNSAVLIRTGHEVVNGEGQVVGQVSPYYPVLEHHNALLGPPDREADVAEAFSDPDRLRDWARSNRGLYRNYLRWSAVVDNMALNDCLTDRESIQLEVHYRFLSAFVHATGTGYTSLDPGRATSIIRRHNRHLATELALLYVCSIGISELRSFAKYVDRRPTLRLLDRAEIDHALRSASALTTYFWFPRVGKPTQYDYVEEANRRAHRERVPGDWSRPSVRPDAIPNDEVGYYRDPFGRLAHLHTGGNEMSTGFGHAPLW